MAVFSRSTLFSSGVARERRGAKLRLHGRTHMRVRPQQFYGANPELGHRPADLRGVYQQILDSSNAPSKDIAGPLVRSPCAPIWFELLLETHTPANALAGETNSRLRPNRDSSTPSANPMS
jgi:hypothetical protein